MPIAVVCPGCKVRFSVNEKFAGKRGPCPKCKTVILVPTTSAPEIKIAEPEQYASAGKDSKGRPVSKPIARVETKFRPRVAVAIGGIVLTILFLALTLRSVSNTAALKPLLVAAGLLAVSPPLALAGYTFLRDDELAPYVGKPLWIRAAICGLAYALLWGLFALVPPDFVEEIWEWVIVGPLFVSIGAAAAWALFDFDFGSGAVHYGFYLLMTVLLRAATGLPAIWEHASRI